MPLRKFLLPSLLLVCLLSAGTVALWQEKGARLFAQEDSRPTGRTEIYLPFVFSAFPSVPVSNDEAPTSNDELSGPVTDHGSHPHDHAVPLIESWPPQPVGIEDVLWVESIRNEEIIAAQLLVDEAEAIASASPLVQEALGTDYVHSTTTYEHRKTTPSSAGKGEDPIRVAYFSYTKNATVAVMVADNKVTSIQSIAASTYQPEPTRRERTDAIELARDYFLAQGENRVNQLHGFVIMAYHNQGATGFYDARVLYVTFHESLEERPEYRAWVDLSHETILEAVVETYEQTVPTSGSSSISSIGGATVEGNGESR